MVKRKKEKKTRLSNSSLESAWALNSGHMSTITSSSSYQSLLLCVGVSTTTQAPAFLLICFLFFFFPTRSLSCFLPAQHFSVFSWALSSFWAASSNPRVTALPWIPVVHIIIPNNAKFKYPEGSVLQYQRITHAKKPRKGIFYFFFFKGTCITCFFSILHLIICFIITSALNLLYL